MILIVGAGAIGLQYADILSAMALPFTLICRSEQTAKKVAENTNHCAVATDVSLILANNAHGFTHAIVATAIADLASVTRSLLLAGVKHILVEKPLTFSVDQAKALVLEAEALAANVYIAFNRRFFPSVQMLKTLLANDSAIVACRFEFTEWIDKIQWQQKDDKLIEHWLAANSSHVIDLVFHLIGYPKSISCIADNPISVADKQLPASRFVGHGISEQNVIFSYLSCWDAPGRWRLEIMTANNRYLLEPLEQLSITARNSVLAQVVALPQSIGDEFKPGFYQQVEAFLHNSAELLSLQQLASHLQYFNAMAFGCRDFELADSDE